jgi:methionyl-tRNA formyltransferase
MTGSESFSQPAPNKRTLHILGGGVLSGIAEKIAQREGWQVVVRTGQRFVETLPPFSKETAVYVGDDLRKLMTDGGLPAEGDIGFSFSAPWIISQDVIDLFSGNIFNLHAQSLPRFRGGGGASWLILMGERAGGCCIHRLVRKIDAGAIYARFDFKFPEDCRFPDQYDQFISLRSADLLEEWLPKLLRSGETGSEHPIDENISEYWPRLNTDIHAWIDWSWSLNDIQRFCDAFSYPFAGAQTLLRGTAVRFRKVRVLHEPGKFHPFQRGMIYRIQGGLSVAHNDGTLVVEEFSTQNSHAKILLGDRFYTPQERLTEAMSRRIQYRPSGDLVDN